MANAYCLPKKYANAFLKALQDGTINPQALADMNSAQRRAFFDPIVGAENAAEVNALFESKLLLKDRQRGLISWAKKVGGITDEARRDLLSKIQRMPEGILNPATENKFLADLAEQKLGVAVTADEAKEIFDLAKAAETLKADAASMSTPEGWTAYGRAKIALTEKIESLKPNGRTWGQFALEAVNIPRTIMSTLDLSAPLVQGWGMEASGNWRDAFRRMFSYFANEDSYQNLRGWMLGHPDFDVIEKSGLSLTELGHKLSAREETIQSTLVEQAWGSTLGRVGAPNFVRASNRAFTGFVNYVRFKTMTDWMAAARMNGIELTPELLRDFATTINDFSGRGSIGGKRAENLITGLNALFFAPRKTVGTIKMFFSPANMLNPHTSKLARVKAVKMLAGSVLYTSAVIGLARAMGSPVDLDPRSSNFLQIPIGDTKFDVTGGNASYLRFLARMATGQMVTARDAAQGDVTELGEGYRGTTRADLLLSYLRNKLAPVAAFIADALYGSDPIGREFSVTEQMRDKLMPMTVNDFIDFAQNDPGNYAAVLPALTAIFGVSMSPPTPGMQRAKRDVWGDPIGTPHDDVVTRTLNRVGVMPDLPPRKIRGVELTDAQYDLYQQYSGRLMKMALARAIQTRGFDRWPIGQQEKVLRDTWNNMREQAANMILAKNVGMVREAQRIQRERMLKGSTAAQERRAQ